MRYAVMIVGLIVVVIAIVVIVGSTLPVKHTVTREATYRATPTQLFELVRNVSDYPSWQKDVTKVEILPLSVVSAYLMGHTATIDKYLDAVSMRYQMVLPVS